jgi:hypothetical protein
LCSGIEKGSHRVFTFLRVQTPVSVYFNHDSSVSEVKQGLDNHIFGMGWCNPTLIPARSGVRLQKSHLAPLFQKGTMQRPPLNV